MFVENPELKSMIVDSRNKDFDDTNFVKLFRSSKLLCPAIENVEDGKKFYTFFSATNSDKKRYLLLFTDWTEVSLWRDEKVDVIVCSLNNLKNILATTFDGLVINISSDNLLIPKDYFYNKIIDDNVILAGERVYIGEPKEYPTDMIRKLKKYFASCSKINKAFLQWMIRDSEPSYLLVIDSDEMIKNDLANISNICSECTKNNVDIVMSNTELGKIVSTKVDAFYDAN